MKKRHLTYPDPEYALVGEDDGGDAPTGDENSAADVKAKKTPDGLDTSIPWEDLSGEYHVGDYIKYKPFKPIPREIMGIFQRSWWDKTWHDRHLLFQVFWNVSLSFSSYSIVFAIAIYFSMVGYKNGMIRTI
jgi:hypothetical protein